MKRYLLLLLFFNYSVLKAQTLRPDVLVVGNNNAAVGAAIQAAKSNVKTILLLQAGGFDIEPFEGDLNSGIQHEFLQRFKAYNRLLDSTKVDVSVDKQTANEVLKQWTDSIKNLTIIRNTPWVKADRSGNNWYFKLSDGRTLRPEVLVNINDEKLNTALKVISPPIAEWQPIAYDKSTYKTNVATGKSVNGSVVNGLSLYSFLVPNQENLVFVSDEKSMLAGQSAGAIAAYAGFFNFKTSQSNLKAIQVELVDFKMNLMPFADVPLEDRNWKAIQFVGITGLLKADAGVGGLLFNPDKVVAAEEIREPLKEHFFKAQIWFEDHKSSQITVAAAIEMVCYLGNKALENTRKLVEKKWSTDYGFPEPFDAEQQISRRQLAVLLNEFCSPFDIIINKEGKISK
jgi:hypothetical protein